MAIDRNTRAARNQSVFREVNERVLEAKQGGLQAVAEDGFALQVICECANAGCHETIDISVEENEAIRASPIRFLIEHDHEWPDVERIVVAHDHYVVVEKVGPSGNLAADLAVDWRRDREWADWPVDSDGAWDDIELLLALRESLKERAKAGDLRARLPLKVVVAFLGEFDYSHMPGQSWRAASQK